MNFSTEREKFAKNQRKRTIERQPAVWLNREQNRKSAQVCIGNQCKSSNACNLNTGEFGVRNFSTNSHTHKHTSNKGRRLKTNGPPYEA